MPDKSKTGYHHGNLPDALLRAAIRVLRTRGVVGLSLRELATELGVSHGAPYRHFRNKSDLMKAVAVEGFRNLERACVDARRKHPDHPRRQLFEAGMGYLLFVAHNREIADLMFGRMFAGEADRVALDEAATRAVHALAVIVENGKRAGLYGERDTDDLVLASLSAVHGLSMLVSGGFLGARADSEAKMRAVAERVFGIVMEGMFV